MVSGASPGTFQYNGGCGEEFSVDLPKLFPLAARENRESGPRGSGVGVKKGSDRSKSLPEPLAALLTSTLRDPESGRLGPGGREGWEEGGISDSGGGGARKAGDPGCRRCS